MQDYVEGKENEEENLKETELEITECALFRTPTSPSINTMKFPGLVKNCPVTILIDSGSSHNFIDLGLVKKLKSHLDTGHVFNVKIAVGGKVFTQGTLSQAAIKILEYREVSDLYIITLGGFDKLYMQLTKDVRTLSVTSLTSQGAFIDISAL